jgi:hypothetical protein
MPTDSLIFWPYDVTTKAIPSGWLRDTAYNDRFFQGDDSSFTAPANSGSATHTHTPSPNPHGHTEAGHTHDISGTVSRDGFECNAGANTVTSATHDHETTASASAAITITNASVTLSGEGARPPFMRAIPIYPSSANENFPDDGVCFTDQARLPGFDVTAALDGKYFVGSNAGDGSDGGGTGGSANHNHSDSHFHATSAHVHTKVTVDTDDTSDVATLIGVASRVAAHHDVSLNSAIPNTDAPGLTVSNESNDPAYIELLGVTADGAQLTAGMIVGFRGAASAIPSGWRLCDGQYGTTDCTDRQVRMSDTVSDIGNTGGADTHDHDITDHVHTISHSHTESVVWKAGSTTAPIVIGSPTVDATDLNHGPHPWIVTTEAPTTSSASLTVDTVDGRYQRRTLIWIQMLKRVTLGAVHKSNKRILVAA